MLAVKTSLDHGHLRSFLDQRVRDGVLRRAIGKWLNAGVLEEGRLWHPEAGTPQGGVISPLLANICLHEVLDKWFEMVVKPRLRGRALLVRYAHTPAHTKHGGYAQTNWGRGYPRTPQQCASAVYEDMPRECAEH